MKFSMTREEKYDRLMGVVTVNTREDKYDRLMRVVTVNTRAGLTVFIFYIVHIGIFFSQMARGHF